MSNLNLETPSISEENYVYCWRLWHENFDEADLQLIQSLCPPNGLTILDLGCAAGRLTFKLAPVCKFITGIDVQPQFLEAARKELQSFSYQNLEFREMSAHKLTFPAEQFDLVVSTWSLHEMADPQQVLKEVYRVLKSGGGLFVIGLLSGSDYDQIIAKFVAGVKPVDPTAQYEQPIKRIFGSNARNMAPPGGFGFKYVFTNPEIAFEAFLFAFDYWHSTKLSAPQRNILKTLIEKHIVNGAVHLNFPADVYFATKTASITA